MSGLFGSLSAAARALEAQRYGIDVAGQNIANVNTPGYTRRSALLAAVPGTDARTPGGGVTVTGLSAARDSRIEQRLRQELPAEERQSAIAQALDVVQTAIGEPGASLDSAMSGLFDAFSALAADPTSSSTRQQTLMQAQSVAAAFRDMSSRLDLARRDADSSIGDGVASINALLKRAASLNASLSKVPPGNSESLDLQDQLGTVLKDLSGLVDVSTVAHPDGGVDISLADGSPLVLGTDVYALSTGKDAAGLTTIVSQGRDVTGEFSGGRIGGWLQVRDRLIGGPNGYMQAVDQLAYDFSTQVNAAHQAGYDLAGTAGGPLFTPLASSAGAAAAMSVDAAVAGDPAKIAAAGTTNAGDNQNARTLANLRDARVLDGGTSTLLDKWGQIVYQVGLDASTAADEQASRAAIVSQVEALREQTSGVSLDEEAMTLMKFQRAYEANARFFQAVGDTLDDLFRAFS